MGLLSWCGFAFALPRATIVRGIAFLPRDVKGCDVEPSESPQDRNVRRRN